jgi:hypothetical protein
MPDPSIDFLDMTLEDKIRNRVRWFAQQLHAKMPIGVSFALVMCRKNGNDPLMFSSDMPHAKLIEVFGKASRQAAIESQTIDIFNHPGKNRS